MNAARIAILCGVLLFGAWAIFWMGGVVTDKDGQRAWGEPALGACMPGPPPLRAC